jgi:glyoxylase-like metal-dependent hydrolase (beta-lactamase superfamily II)
MESDGPFVEPADFYPGVSLDEIRRAAPAGPDGRISDDGKLVFAVQSFLLQRPGLNILIDLGTGNDKERPKQPWWHHQALPFLQTLESLGVKPGDVSYDLLTHLHEDHVGFATTLRGGQWEPTFPNARYVVSKIDWDYFTQLSGDNRHPSIDDSVLPLEGRGVIDWGAPGEAVAGIRMHLSSAHSPGLLLFELPDQNVWFVGDLFHHPAQISRPGWKSSNYDVHPDLVGVEREKYFARFAESGAIVYAAHAGYPYRIVQAAGGGFTGSIDRAP